MAGKPFSWSRGRKLGSGGFGDVYLGSTNDPKDPIFAVKSSNSPVWLGKEFKILKEIQGSDYIVRYLGKNITLGKDEKEIYNIFLEYATQGTLADLIKKSKKSKTGRLLESQVIKYTRMILCGLRDLHNKGYVHCDLKPSNILVFDGGNLKLADFGLSSKVGAYEPFDGKCFKGTPNYMSPESVIAGKYDPPLDIWSLGCTVVEMITGKPFWHSCWDDVEILYNKLASCEALPKLPEKLSEAGKDFLKKCLDTNHQTRWSAEMLLNHPFVAEKKEVPSWSTSFLPHVICNRSAQLRV